MTSSRLLFFALIILLLESSLFAQKKVPKALDLKFPTDLSARLDWTASDDATAQASSTPAGTKQSPAKKSKNGSTITGCVGKLNTYFILTESARSHSYQLEESKDVKVARYLGKEVEITGAETPTMHTDHPSGVKANPITISVQSIKTIQEMLSKLKGLCDVRTILPDS